jgi:hypothetical protein
LVRGRDQLVVGPERARAVRLDDFVGHHRRERIAAADIPRKLVQERNRIGGELPASGGDVELVPAVTDQPEPSQTLIESLEHSHVRLAMRRPEQVRVPLFRPPLRRVTHGRCREPVRLRKLHATIRRRLEKPPSWRCRRLGQLFAGSRLVPSSVRVADRRSACHS